MVYLLLALCFTFWVVCAVLWRADHDCMKFETQELRRSLASTAESCRTLAALHHRSEAVVKEQQVKIADLEAKLVASRQQVSQLRTAVDAMVANTKAVVVNTCLGSS